MMDQARTLLSRIPALQRPCDLDLVVFFARHPRTLMTSEQLAHLLGYPLNEIARSLEAVLAARFLTRTQNPARLPRMYVFAAHGPNDGPLLAVVEFACTREGRLALRGVLSHLQARQMGDLATPAGDDEMAQPDARPTPGRRKPKTTQEPRSDKQLRRKR